jgi:hypothetical protein
MTEDDALVAPSRTLIIHASAVCINDGALVFLGPSGTGKSTICRLLKSHAEPIADDAVYLVPQIGGGWLTGNANRYSAEPSSQVQRFTPGNVPLRAIFRLHQAPVPLVQQIDSLQTCRYLTDAFFEIHCQRLYNAETKRGAFSELAAVSRHIPGYRLHFNLSNRVPEAIIDTLHLRSADLSASNYAV